MSKTQPANEQSTPAPAATPLDLKIEVVPLPVSDVDRAKRFYGRLGWRLDADFANGDGWRAVQMTPPGSSCSVIFGKGFTAAEPGSVQGTFLVVDDIQAARGELTRQGAEVSEVFHFDGVLRVSGTEGRLPGAHPEGRSYGSYATFSDPDGNTWLLQEVKTRLPGRGLDSNVQTLTDLLRETEGRHGAYEAAGPAHHWSEWYAAYIVARQRGRTPEDAASEAAHNVERARAEPT